MDITILKGKGPYYCHPATELLITARCDDNIGDTLNSFEEAISVWPVQLKWGFLRPLYRLSSFYLVKDHSGRETQKLERKITAEWEKVATRYLQILVDLSHGHDTIKHSPQPSEIRETDGKTKPPPVSFQCFPKLPPELRCMIWDFALSQGCIFIPYARHFKQIRSSPDCRNLLPAARVCKESHRVAMAKKNRVVIYENRGFTQQNGGETTYGLVDRTADVLYLDIDLVREDFQETPNYFENIILFWKEQRYLELQDLIHWCDSLCTVDERGSQSSAIKKVSVVQASYDIAYLKDRADIHESLLILDLDKRSDTSWLSQVANFDKEVARLQSKKCTLLVRKDDGQGVKEKDGKYVLWFEGMKVQLPLEAEVKKWRDAGTYVNWHIRMHWTTFTDTARQIWRTSLQHLGAKGFAPAFRRVIQFKEPDPDSEGPDTDEDSTTTDVDESDWYTRQP